MPRGPRGGQRGGGALRQHGAAVRLCNALDARGIHGEEVVFHLNVSASLLASLSVSAAGARPSRVDLTRVDYLFPNSFQLLTQGTDICYYITRSTEPDSLASSADKNESLFKSSEIRLRGSVPLPGRSRC